MVELRSCGLAFPALYPPAALPPISMGRAAVPPTNGVADPYGPVQGARGWVWRRDSWFACMGCQKVTHQKQRDGQVLALGGHQSMTITNNQQIVGGSGILRMGGSM